MATRKPKIVATAALRQGINQAWQAIAFDVMELGVRSNENAMQITLDSGLETYGTPEALAEARALYAVHGFNTVCRALAKQLQLL